MVNKKCMIAVLCALMVGMVAFTGCIEDAKRIDGTMHNTTDYKVRVEFTNKANNEKWQWGLEADDSRAGTIEVGSYSLTAFYGYDADDAIASEDMTVLPTHYTFKIIVYNDSLYAESY